MNTLAMIVFVLLCIGIACACGLILYALQVRDEVRGEVEPWK